MIKAKKVLVQGILYILIFLTFILLELNNCFSRRIATWKECILVLVLKFITSLVEIVTKKKHLCSWLCMYLLLDFAELSDLLESFRHTCLNIDLLFPKSLSCGETPNKIF